MFPRVRRAALAVSVAAAFDAGAVQLSADGRGQALIFPYYTVRSNEGNAFNTYLSIVNPRGNGNKALRVRFREARNGREVAALNLWLGSNDMWTGALVPDGEGTRLISADMSCTDPPISPTGLAFANAGYTGVAADDAGAGLDRTREGYIEVLEMGTVTGAAATAITPIAGTPPNCAAVRPLPPGPFGAPQGGLSGSLTLINVASGQDFSTAPEALEDLASAPYVRPASDPYPSFTATEIDPVSIVSAKGFLYRSNWARGVDAVSAVLMRKATVEYVLDPAVRAGTDLVLTMPTRYAYVTPDSAAGPFTGRAWSQDCSNRLTPLRGEQITVVVFNREAAGFAPSVPPEFEGPQFPPWVTCGSVQVMTVQSLGGTRGGHSVLGSLAATAPFSLDVQTFLNGWIGIELHANPMVSSATSTRTNLRTGEIQSGGHTFGTESPGNFLLGGLPIVGFMARSLSNGLLTCGGASCQGNYGSAVPFTYSRSITP